ncbi:MAG TPA: VIT domain-containing protein [Enhygromyxa sp.]|nr:VIT domain-containing protein [Enhygromyxa sp.]
MQPSRVRPCLATGVRTISFGAGFCLLVACTPWGFDASESATPDEAQQDELGLEVVYPWLPDDDREQPVEALGEDPRCWKDGKPGEALAIADPQASPETGTLAVVQQGQLLALPLQHTKFDTVVVGTVAETTVTQLFANPFDQPIEAIYMFPLHERAAVDDYRLTVGSRSIRGQIETREQARRIYERAKHEGHTAGLLEQQRPNVFTQHVANIAPGESVEISIHVVQPLEQEDGVFSLVLPTVVGPRYVPSTVHDADKITAPIIPQGYVTCADLDVAIAIESGLRPRTLRSKFHAIDIERERDVVRIELDRAAGPVVANRDFVLSWDLGQSQPQAAIVADGAHFTLTVQPPKLAPNQEVVPRELVFVVDTSGSMDGEPIAIAKALMRRALAGLRPDDTFTVLNFADGVAGLSDTLLTADPHNVGKGLAYVDSMVGAGGTSMTAGIHAALDLPREPGRMRIVLFLTDGFIGNEAEVLSVVEQKLGNARLFSLGIGSSPNRYLLDGIAEVGRGVAAYAGVREDIDPVMDLFYERTEAPVLSDLEIDWQGLAVAELYPDTLPDLFAGQALTVFGRYEGAPSGKIVLRGEANGAAIAIPVSFDIAEADALTGVSSLWARRKIDALLGAHATRQAITEVALQHRILTEFTSFVAVDEAGVVDDFGGAVPTVVQALSLPEGTLHEGGDGGTAAGSARRSVRVPQIRHARAEAAGALDKDIIRRIVRAHINEVRGCYNTALTRNPATTGRVAILFTIMRSGEVTSAVVEINETGDTKLGSCIAARAKTWRFPEVEGGSGTAIVVSYPFVLRPR